MPDPSASLRSIILFNERFDRAKVRALCIQITAGMKDHAKAVHLMQMVMDEIDVLCLSLDMDPADRSTAIWRQHAMDAADKMIKAALG